MHLLHVHITHYKYPLLCNIMKYDSEVMKAAHCANHVFFGAVFPNFLINLQCVCLSISQCFQFVLKQVYAWFIFFFILSQG